jgi:hypothetical protein
MLVGVGLFAYDYRSVSAGFAPFGHATGTP